MIAKARAGARNATYVLIAINSRASLTSFGYGKCPHPPVADATGPHPLPLTRARGRNPSPFQGEGSRA